MKNTELKISVVTPSFNQAQFIERTIQSVLRQNYPHLDYIIMDGGSTDGTLALLKKYEADLQWLSEPDGGQAEAINKGFKRATGDIICWLNADDEFALGALPTVAAYFEQHPAAQFVYGEAETIDEKDKIYGRRGNVKATNFAELAAVGDFIVQPAAFWRSSLLAEVGLLDESLRYCLDYEYWLRISQHYPLHYLNIPLARERFHHQAKTTQATLKRIEEIEAVARRYHNPGIPQRFRSEQTAVYFVETLRQIRAANWTKASHFARLTWQRFPPDLRFFPHLLALLLGSKGVTRMRLYYDLIRTRSRRVASKSIGQSLFNTIL
jgi:glycosyltransferase involved in cell wall biosynthesis